MLAQFELKRKDTFGDKTSKTLTAWDRRQEEHLATLCQEEQPQ